MQFENNTTLRVLLARGQQEHLSTAHSFDLDEAEFERLFHESLVQLPHLKEEELRAVAAYKIITRIKPQPAPAVETPAAPKPVVDKPTARTQGPVVDLDALISVVEDWGKVLLGAIVLQTVVEVLLAFIRR